MYLTDLYEDDLEISIKVVIVGNGAVGKSSLIQRYCRGIFTNSYKKTIGVDFLEKQLRILSEDVRLMLWDTAGQEEFDAITKAYYRGAQACVIGFSTTDRSSFEAIRKWKRKVEDECGHVPMVLVQNKIDLMHEAQVTSEEVERLAKELRMRLFRTSVKEDVNVASVFRHLAENYVHKVKSFDPYMSDLSFRPNPYLSATTATGNYPTRRLHGNTKNNHNMGNRYLSSGAYNGGYVSPQDYLKNPMFDSLNQHRHRYWPSAVMDRTTSAAANTITLRPLGKLTKKNVHKRMPMGKTACRVL